VRFLVVDGGSTLVVIVALRLQLYCGLSIIFINLYDLAI
jgi:hypothetical protein